MRPMGGAVGAVDQLSDGWCSFLSLKCAIQASGNEINLDTKAEALPSSRVKMRVCRRKTRIMKGTHTRTMVRAKRQSLAGMVNSVIPKTD